MLKREDKEALIANVKADIENARGIFLTNLVGVDSNSANSIRKGIRDVKGKVVITRNTLLKRAAMGTVAEKMLEGITGPNALAFAFEDAAAVAKCLKNASEDHEEVVTFKSGILNGELLSPEQVKELANLPSRDEMLATTLATMMAPVSSFARVLYAIQEKKEEGGSEPVAEAATETPAEETAETKTETTEE